MIENIIRGNKWQWAVAGIGMNVNQTAFAEGMGKPVSLKQITGKEFKAVDLAREIRDAVVEHFALLEDDKDSLLAAYNAILYKRGERVRLKKENIVFDAVIKEVLPDGRLLVDGAAWEYFSFGEVQWVA